MVEDGPGAGAMAGPPAARRPIKTRERRWARGLAFRLARRGVTPNAISCAGVLGALAAAACLVIAPHAGPVTAAALLVLAAVAIQLRLLANMLDGLVAVEAGRQTRTGDLFNEIPDRVSDIAILGAAGWAIGASWGPALGLAASLAAVSTAYARLLGGSLGQPQDYCGPQSKSQRMALMTAACLAAAVLAPLSVPARSAVIAAALALVTLGSAVTVVRRIGHVAARLPR